VGCVCTLCWISTEPRLTVPAMCSVPADKLTKLLLLLLYQELHSAGYTLYILRAITSRRSELAEHYILRKRYTWFSN
jgi:hypothetical protein